MLRRTWSLPVVLVVTLCWIGGVIAQNSGNLPPPPPLSESSEALKVAQWVKDLPPVDPEASYFSAIGVLNFMQLRREVQQYISANGVTAFYDNPEMLEAGLANIQDAADRQLAILAAGDVLYLRDVQNFPWGMIEVAPGDYRFTISDVLVQSAESAGMVYVGAVTPYAAWDQAGYAASNDEMCQRLFTEDFFYLAPQNAMDRLVNHTAFLAWLGKMVERYDADGVDDAPGLQRGVKYWQIHNEPEGDRCGNFRGDEAAFVALMQEAYATVKAACAECMVLNGGAAIPQWKTVQGGDFWAKYAEAGGAQYVDVVALHYNEGKVDGGDEANFAAQVQAVRSFLGTDKPVWVTEFGVMHNIPPGGRFVSLSELEAAAWYMRFYTVGLANGLNRFFSDSSSFFNQMQMQIYLPYYVNKLLQAKLGGFSEVKQLADGQYRFTVGGKPVYVLWSGIPAELTGSVQVTDMYGNVQPLDASAIAPSSATPVIVELAS
jgi:hypothetical protein